MTSREEGGRKSGSERTMTDVVGPSCDPRLLELSVLLEAGGTVGVMVFVERVLVIIPIFS
jgi:hypothetical protein